MTMWPVSARVNKPEHDDAAVLAPIRPDSNLGI
jgi:hypothetical protein